jgi:hypothetical protein
MLAACAPSVDGHPPIVDDVDAGSRLPPPAPRLDPLPVTVPYRFAPIRGQAPGARRVLIEGASGATLVESVLPDGTFCIEVPLVDDAAHTFVVWSQADDGTFSERAASVTLGFDGAAPPPPGVALCSGADPSECTSGELCGNGLDDDCNGLVDALDPACSDCPPDALEPNDGPAGPLLALDTTYEDLTICAGERDYHPFIAEERDHLRLSVTFVHDDGDIDVRFHDLDNERILDTSVGTGDSELIDYVVTRTGRYALEVYGFGDAENHYQLELSRD